MGRRGLVATLFDLEFRVFLTASLIPAIYAIVLAIVLVVGTISFFKFLFAGNVVVALLVPVQMFLTLVTVRVVLEGLLCLFRIAEHAGAIRAKLESSPEA